MSYLYAGSLGPRGADEVTQADLAAVEAQAVASGFFASIYASSNGIYQRGKNIASVIKTDTGIFEVTFIEPCPEGIYYTYFNTYGAATDAVYTCSLVSNGKTASSCRIITRTNGAKADLGLLGHFFAIKK